MPDLLVGVSLAACWGIVVVVWIAGAVYGALRASKGRVRDRSSSLAYLGATVICAAAVMLGYDFFHGLTLDAAWIKWTGLVLLLVSTGFSLWARFTLGTMWSATPQVGAERRLRTGGPYGVTRHPIYTGFLGMIASTTFLAGGHELLAIFAVGAVLFEVKIHQEERLMLAAFPAEYAAYRRRVPQIVPGLRLPGS